MPDLLPVVVIVVPLLAAVYVVVRWVAKAEQQAQAGQMMGRVYYPRRGMKADVPELKRRPEPERES